MIQIDPVLTDRGSKYAVSGGAALDRAGADVFLKALKRKKKFAKATHNTWGLVLPDGTPLKSDDGEAGAGIIIPRILAAEGITGQIVVVTRWYGGVHLGGDRFRHVQTCVRGWIDAFRAGG